MHYLFDFCSSLLSEKPEISNENLKFAINAEFFTLHITRNFGGL